MMKNFLLEAQDIFEELLYGLFKTTPRAMEQWVVQMFDEKDSHLNYEQTYFWRVLNDYHDTANETWQTPWAWYLYQQEFEEDSK